MGGCRVLARDYINLSPEIIHTVLTFVGDPSISRRYAGDTTLHEFLVLEIRLQEDLPFERAAVWEGHWHRRSDTAG